MKQDAGPPLTRAALIRDSGPAACLGWLALAALSDLQIARAAATTTQYDQTFFHTPWHQLVLTLLAAWIALGVRQATGRARVLRIVLVVGLLLEATVSAQLLGTPRAWLVPVLHALCWAAALLLVADYLRGHRSITVLETTVLMLFAGLLLVDFSFDLPYTFEPMDKVLMFRSFSNNVLHIGTWVHEILLPACFVVIAACVVIAGLQHRRVADIARVGLLLAAGTAVFLSIEPAERLLATLSPDQQQVPLLLATINRSHLISFGVIIAALALAPPLRPKR